MSRTSQNLLLAALLAPALALMAPTARAVAPLGTEFEGVDVKNKLGEKIDANIPFSDPTGKTVSMADFLDGVRPVVFTLNFYRCTSVCSIQLNELVTTLKVMGWVPGKEPFRIVTVSFDPSDTVDIAAGKQDTYRKELIRQLAAAEDEELTEAEIAERAKSVDWTFLVAREKSIRAILDNMGYSVRYDQNTDQYAHSPVTYVLSPRGEIARYLWNLQIPPQDLKFALMETSNGKLGSFGDKVLMSCFDYSRDSGGYVPFAWGIMRIGGGLVLLILGVWLLRNWRREKKRSTSNLSLATHSESRP